MDFANLFISLLFLPICMGQDAGSSSFSVIVKPPDSVQRFRLGEGKGLTCSSVPEGELAWYVNDEKITTTDTSARVRIENVGSEVRLRFKDIQESDAGSYKCMGKSASLSDERTITVEVFVPLSINSPQEQYGIIDSDGTVKCEASGKPVPTITWKFENGSLIKNSDKYVISPNTLTIKKLTIEDSKRYNCYIYVEGTGDDRDYYINFEVVKPPKIALLPTFEPANPKVGDTVKIHCMAEGVPPPTYTFFKAGNPVSEDKVDKVNGFLTLTDVQREDEAAYTCVASNKGGSDNKTNTLDVKIIPTITEIYDVTDAYEGNKVSLKCSAEGDPEPTVSWKKDGVQESYLDTGSRDSDPVITTEDVDNLVNAIIKRQTKILTFNAIRPEDAGSYTCTAFNLVGTTNRTVKIAVKYKPNFNTNFKVTEFWGWPGHVANLTCQASANELASFQWFRPDKENPDDRTKDSRVESDAIHTVSSLVTVQDHHLSSSSLLVNLGTAEQAEDRYGQYICVASNTLGKESQVVTLKQATSPGQPKVKIIETLSTSAMLSLIKPENNGGVDVTSYKYKLTKNGLQIKEDDVDVIGDSTPLEVKSLQAGTKYTLEVSARNAVGIGSPVTILVNTLDVSRPEKMTIESPAIGEYDTMYVLQWASPVDGGSPITKYNISFRKCLVENENADPKQWKVKSYIEQEAKVISVSDGSARSHTLLGLDGNSFYDVRITAVNNKGESDPVIQIIRTATQAKTLADAGVVTDQYEDTSVTEIIDDGGKVNIDNVTDGGEALSEPSVNTTVGLAVKANSRTASLSTGAIVGILIAVLALIIIIAVVVIIVVKKPEFVQNFRGRLPGKAGEEERGKKDDGKDTAEEEKLIKKEDTVKIENEQEETKNDVIEEHPEEFEPDSKPEQPEAEKPAAVEKAEELKTPAATTEIKITPETPEKPENPAA